MNLRITKTGFVGIGVTNPTEKLQVQGNASIFGNVQVTQNLQILGSSVFQEGLTAQKGIMFNSEVGITYKPSDGTLPSILSFGKYLGGGGLVQPFPCYIPYLTTTINTFNGLIAFTGLGESNKIEFPMMVGFDGTNGIIEATNVDNGTPASASLLLNYTCGRDIRMGGTAYMVKAHIGNQKQVAPSIHTDALLTINGKMVAKSAFVTINNWADYVFGPEYKLPELKEVEAFYKLNRHLPEIPSEKEVVENGIDVAEMNKLLLKKIEELTIYLVEQQKQIEKNNADIKKLEALIKDTK